MCKNVLFGRMLFVAFFFLSWVPLAQAKGIDDARAGLELADIGLNDIAVSSFEDALKDKTLSTEAREKTLYNLGTLYLRQNDPVRAISMFDQALLLSPKEPRTLVNRAEALRMQIKHNEAIAGYDMAISIKRDLSDAHFGKGLSLLSLNRLDDAEKSFRTGLRYKKTPAYYVGLGQVLIRQKKFSKAMDAFDSAIDMEPKFARAYLFRSSAYVGLGQKKKAGKDLTTAFRLAPSDPLIREVYGQKRFGKKSSLHVAKSDIKALAAPRAKAPVYTNIPKGMPVSVQNCDSKGWCRAMSGADLLGYVKKSDLKAVN